MTSRKTVTQSDIARAAGVSRKTVSRVINNSPEVTETTRKHVEQVIQQLHYQPNRIASSLASGKTNTIGVLVHHSVQETFTYPYFSELIGGISKGLNANRVDILLRFMEEGMSYTELYAQRRVDGLVVLNAPIDVPEIKALLDIPCVFTSRITLENNRSNWVDSDFHEGIYLAANYLIGLGHRRIGLIPGPIQLALSHLKSDGYRSALTQHGIEVDESLIQFDSLFLDNQTIKDRLTHYWLTMSEPPTAFIMSDDFAAINLIRELNALNYRVPHDISVIGFDDTLLAQTSTPRLTSIGQQAFQKGITTVNTLLKILSSDAQTPIQISLKMDLQLRESTGPIR